MTNTLYTWRGDQDEEASFRPWSQHDLHAHKRMRMHVDHDEPSMWRDMDGSSGQTSRLRAESAQYHMPGFEPGNLSRFGTMGLGTGQGGFQRAAAHEIGAVMAGLPTTRINIDGLPGLTPSGPPMPPTSRVFGGGRAMERVTTSIIARPFFVPNQDQFTNQNFRIGDLIFRYVHPQEDAAQEASFQDVENVYTVATFPQVRSFEDNHVMFADTHPAEVGMKSIPNATTGAPEYRVIDTDGVPVLASQERASCFSRWLPLGVCVEVDSSNPLFVVLVICVQGPTLMRNYFWPNIYCGAQVYLRGITKVPAHHDKNDAMRNALTIKSIDVWPNLVAGDKFDEMIDARERDLTSAKGEWNLHMIGTHQWIDPPEEMLTTGSKARSNQGGVFYDDELEGLQILGTVLDLYNDVVQDTSEHHFSTGYLPGSIYGSKKEATRSYGELRINVVAQIGLTPLMVAQMNMARARTTEDD